MCEINVFIQAESDAEEKDKQMAALLMRMAQYEEVSHSLAVCWKVVDICRLD